DVCSADLAPRGCRRRWGFPESAAWPGRTPGRAAERSGAPSCSQRLRGAPGRSPPSRRSRVIALFGVVLRLPFRRRENSGRMRYHFPGGGGMSMARVLDVGRENNEFQRLEVLKRNRAKRKQYGQIFVEGVAPVGALLKAGWSVHTVAYDRERPLSAWAQDVLRRARPQKVLRL